MAGRGSLAVPAFLLALAALASGWNPLAAPFGLGVGLAAALLAARARRAGARPRLATAALVVSAAAILSSAAVLALTAGVGRQGEPGSVVASPSKAEVDRALDEAAERTRAGRERARDELDGLGTAAPAPTSKPAPGGR